MKKLLFTTGSPLETEILGKRIGEKLYRGSAVALIGDLGCGKTCFTKGLCAGLSIPKREVNSPSFTLVNEYQGKFPVYHMDLYRVVDTIDTFEEELSDYLLQAKAGVAIIEWAERILPLLSDSYLSVELSVLSARKRKITITGFGEMFCKLLDELENENIRH